jgi:hypothetical protein
LYLCNGDRVVASHNIARDAVAVLPLAKAQWETIEENQVVELYNRGERRFELLNVPAMKRHVVEVHDPLGMCLLLQDRGDHREAIPLCLSFPNKRAAASFYGTVKAVVQRSGRSLESYHRLEADSLKPSSAEYDAKGETKGAAASQLDQLFNLDADDPENTGSSPFNDEGDEHSRFAQKIVQECEAKAKVLISPFDVIPEPPVISPDHTRDPVPVIEALNRQEPEYFSAQGLQEFLRLCSRLHRSAEAEKLTRMKGTIRRQMMLSGYLRFATQESVHAMFAAWRSLRTHRDYSTTVLMMDLQQRCWALERRDAVVRTATSSPDGEPCAEPAVDLPIPSIWNLQKICATNNPLDLLAIHWTTAMKELYCDHLRMTIAALEKRLNATSIEQRPPSRALEVAKHEDRKLDPYHSHLSNVFPDCAAESLFGELLIR